MAANLGNTANGNNKKLALWHEWSAVLLCELLLRPLDTYMLLGWYASLKLALEMKIEKSKAKTKGENAEPGDVRNTWVLFVDCLATLLYEQQMEHERVEDALKELFVQLVLLWAYSLIVVGQEVTADIDASASAPHSSHMHISGNLDAKVSHAHTHTHTTHVSSRSMCYVTPYGSSLYICMLTTCTSQDSTKLYTDHTVCACCLYGRARTLTGIH